MPPREGLDLRAFSDDRQTFDAVVRNLMIIGEAASHMPPEVVTRHPEIPWRDMADMRNVVVHEYFVVDVHVVWETATRDLPPLATPLSSLLDASDFG